MISGGAKRIGRAIALYLAEKGFDIIIHYSQSKKEAEELVSKLRKLKVNAFCIKTNLLNDSEISSLVKKSNHLIGKPIDCLLYTSPSPRD